MKHPIVIFAFLVFFNWSCKQNATSHDTKTSQNDTSKYFGLINQQNLLSQQIKDMRMSAASVLEHRQKEGNKKSYTSIDKDVWVFDAILIGSKMTTGDSLEGRWLDFKEDLTYSYGRFDVIDGKGRYYYELEKETIILVDDDPMMKPQEFEVKARNDMLILVGQYEYKDNNIQTKLLRQATLPTKKSVAQ